MSNYSGYIHTYNYNMLVTPNKIMQKKNKNPLIFANWKMHKTISSSENLIEDLLRLLSDISGDNIIISPPFTLLHSVSKQLFNTGIKTAGQDCSGLAEDQGAFTGDISALMLKDIGCEYVIIGHCERRKYHHETDAEIKNKIINAHKAGLNVVLCLGENLKQREDGDYLNILKESLIQSLPDTATIENTIIAYEPIWAIGTGKTADVDQIDEIHKFLRKEFIDLLLNFPQNIAQTFENYPQIIYGGSVNVDNAKLISSSEYVDGFLVGGASLDAQKFYKIIQTTQIN